MTHAIKLSAMKAAGIEDVRATVSAYAAELKVWRDHMGRVTEHMNKNPPKKPRWEDFKGFRDPNAEFTKANDKWNLAMSEWPEAYPRPTAHPDIVASVNDDGEISYTTVDDGPTDDQVLAYKKGVYFQIVNVAEQAEHEKIMPSGKRRLFGMKVKSFQARDIERMNSEKIAINRDPEASVEKKLDLLENYNPAETRSIEDSTLARQISDTQAKHDAVSLWAAQAHSDIEDLTTETVDDWKLSPFDGN